MSFTTTIKNKMLYKSSICLVFFFVFSFGLVSEVRANDELFSDDFEIYNLGNIIGQGNWVDPGTGSRGNNIVVDTNPRTGTKSLRSGNPENTLVNTVRRNFVSSDAETITQSFWFYPTDRTWFDMTLCSDSFCQPLFTLRNWDSGTPAKLLGRHPENRDNHGYILIENISLLQWHFLQFQVNRFTGATSFSLNEGAWIDSGSWSTSNTPWNNILLSSVDRRVAYIDDFGSSIFKPPVEYLNARVTSVGMTWHEINASNNHDLGLIFRGRGIERATSLHANFYKKDNLVNPVGFLDFNFADNGRDWSDWMFTLRGEIRNLSAGEYIVKTWLENSIENRASRVQSWTFTIDKQTRVLTEADYIDMQHQLDFLREHKDFDDFMGLGGMVEDWTERIRRRFPFSWVFGIHQVWQDEVSKMSKTPVEPLSIVWTLPTITASGASQFSGYKVPLLDLKGANEQWHSQFQVFRQMIIWVLWLSFVFLVVKRTQGFIKDLSLKSTE